jgi:hypothetical protein
MNGTTKRCGLLAGIITTGLVCGSARAAEKDTVLDLRALRPVESGGRSYYEIRSDDRGAFIHAEYRPGDKAAKQAIVLPESERRGRHRLTWRWRALVLPTGGDECASGRGDSAGSVYVAWKRGLRWYGLKYSWSAIGRVGAVCDRHDNAVMRGETIILRSGGPLGTWVDESVDLDAEFRKHLADGDATAEIPDLVGIAVLTDGDQTNSASSADFGGFVMHRVP